MRQATKAVHSGKSDSKGGSPVSDPISVASTYVWDDIETEPSYIYSRYQNPNREALEQAVASLENGQFAVGYASGMAAITSALSIARSGEHVLIARDLYGGSFATAQQILSRHGIDWSDFDPLDPDDLARQSRDNTKVMLIESPTNPLLRVVDVRALAAAAKEKGIVSIVDNTFATPILQNPLDLGIDVVVHSTTKYLGGHSDVVGGIAVTNREHLHKILYSYAKVAGAVPGPFDCWLVLRGIRSISARMKVIESNSIRVAEFLASHPRIAAVYYPGLKSDPGHVLASQQMRGYGGMMAAEIGDSAGCVKTMVSRCKLFSYAASLGGVESLLSWPAGLSHAMMSDEERLSRGIRPNLLRISIGLEDVDDLLEDLEQALKTE